MDEVITRQRGPATFNGPLEAGVRSVALLCAAFPRSYDLQRLIAFDYLLVHTGDIGGPDSLHPPAPLQSAELLVRRRLIERALLLMMTRDLVRREARSDGIRYSAGESAMPYMEALQTDYLRALKQRAAWLVGALGDHTEAQFRQVMRRFFDRWVEEFQAAERSLGSDT
jgi:hypothetical protein